MNWIQKFTTDKTLQDDLFPFLDEYGISGLTKAIQLYRNMHQTYICKTKLSISQINIYDIYYLEIKKHSIIVHTEYGTYHKYGTLNKELVLLSPYGFIKCTQNCIVSLNKIKTIHHNSITLINNTQIPMTRNYAPKVIIAFSQNKSLNL